MLAPLDLRTAPLALKGAATPSAFGSERAPQPYAPPGPPESLGLYQSSVVRPKKRNKIGPVSPSPEHTFDAGPYSRVPQALRWARRDSHWLRNRALSLAAIAWVPLAVFSAAQGLALSDQRRASQLLDI